MHIKKNPTRKWMSIDDSDQRYQSNHNLQNYLVIKESIKILEKILNTVIKKKH